MEVAKLIVDREQSLLAPYAMHSVDSLGRRHPEVGHPYRGPYQRDRDRILHSSAFRRLSHKTQVFTGEMGDYHRTRLTHTLEVASIARTIARALRLNEDLVEALAFAHDLGHPPFGHAGEDVLNECLRGSGGFNHNAQGLRICELLETSYREYPGLNLTHEVLEGQQQRSTKKARRPAAASVGAQQRTPLLEVQVVDTADSIAYDAHDADDSLELGILNASQLAEVPLWQEASARIEKRPTSWDDHQCLKAIVHEVIDWQVNDVIENATRRLGEQSIADVRDVREASWIVTASPAVAKKKANLEEFLFDNVYRHPELLAQRRLAQQAILQLFNALTARPELLPEKFQHIAETDGVPRAAADYIAGMTDRFAFEEHRRVVGERPLVGPLTG